MAKPKPRVPQQVQILSQEEPEMKPGAIGRAYAEGYSDGERKIYETIHELTKKYRTSEEVVIELGKLHGAFLLRTKAKGEPA